MITIPVILEWIGLVVGAAVAGGVLGLVLVRRRLVRRIEAELGKGKVLLVTNSRLRILQEARARARLLDSGVLILLRNGLYYHAWFNRKEVFIPGPAITYIGVSDAKSEAAAARGAVVLRFLNASGKEDGVSIRLLAPDQWVSAIKTHLIARPV